MTRPLILGVGRVGAHASGLSTALGPEHDLGEGPVELDSIDLSPAPGIAVAGAAAMALGCRVRLAGAVGADLMGTMVRSVAARGGLDVELLRPHGRSPFALTVATTTGSRTLARHDPEVGVPEFDLASAMADVSAVLVDGTCVPLQIAIAERARRVGAPVIADGTEVRARIDELVRLADVLITSERLAAELAPGTELGASLDALRALGPRAVVITLGDAGAIGWHGGGVVEIPAFPVDVLDTTGAGAVFHGAFAAGLLGALPFVRCIELAAAAAALACGAIGGWEAVPRRDAVLELARTRR